MMTLHKKYSIWHNETAKTFNVIDNGMIKI